MPHVQTSGFQPLSTVLQGNDHGRDRAVQRALHDGVAQALGIEDPGRSMSSLALALRDRMAAGGNGTDAVPSLLGTLNRALDDAAARLAAQGVSREQIDAGLARFRGRLAQDLGKLAGAGPAGEKPPETSSAIAASHVVRERFSLDIRTGDGDQVAIRFRSMKATEVAAAHVSNGAGNNVMAYEANVISRGHFQMEVDGHLDDSERAAIDALLDKVDGIAMEFFGGDVQGAFDAAARVGLESDALAAIDLRLSYSRSLAAAQRYADNAKAGAESVAPKQEIAPPSMPPVSLPAATSAPAIAAAASPVVDRPDADVAPASEGTATSSAAAISTAKTVSALETITSFAKDVLEKLDEDDETNATRFSLRWKVEFLIKAFGSVALTPAEQAAADALGIALDSQLGTGP